MATNGKASSAYRSSVALGHLRHGGYAEALVPLHPGDKRPIGKNWGRTWTRSALDAHAQTGCNWGIQTGKYPAFDVEGTEWAGILFDLVLEEFTTPSIWRNRTGSDSTLTLVRLDDPFGMTIRKMSIVERLSDGTTRKLFELLGEGQQAMVSGVHPSGDEVFWGVSRTCPMGASDLEGWDVERLQGLVEKLHRNLKNRGLDVHVTGLRDVDDGTVLSDPEECSIDELTSLLAHMPNDGAHYDWDEWVKFGHAIKKASGGSSEGYDAWLEWSAQHPRFDEDTTRQRWDGFSLPDIRAGVGTIREEAKRRDPQGLAKGLMDEIDAPEIDTKSKRTVNPLTGEPRWLAKKIMSRAVKLARSQGVTSRALVSLREFTKRIETEKRRPDIIPGVARPDTVTGIIGAPGAAKSLLSLHYAICASLGVDPRDANKTTPPAIVLANFAEDDDLAVSARARATMDHFLAGVSHDGLLEFVCGTSWQVVDLDETKKNFAVHGTADASIPFGLHELCDLLEAIIAEHVSMPGPDVVLIFDMMRNGFNGDENQRWAVDLLHRVWKAIMLEVRDAGGPSVAIVFTHHMNKSAARKGGGSGGFNSAGSIGIEGNARLILELTRSNPDDEQDPYIIATATKDNYGQTGRREAWEKVVVSSPDGGTSVWMKPLDRLPTQGGLDPFTIGDAVQDLWNALMDNRRTSGPVPVIPKKRGRVGAGCVHIRDIARGPDGTSVMSEEGLHAVLQEGVRVGAWRVGRVQDGSVDTEVGVNVSEGWGVVSRTD